MKRRSLLQLQKLESSSSVSFLAPPPSATLEKYSGPWTKKEVFHLLRRTTIGMSYQQMMTQRSKSLDELIDMLFEELPLPVPPINYDFEADPDVPIGDTWVNAPHNAVNNSNNYRTRSLYGWTIGRLLAGEANIREKMTLFWHNHFATGGINDSRFRYHNITLCRSFATGDFKELTKRMTVDPLMLRYLDGRVNTRRSPNENYARELLELFTIGKGPLAAPGDYTFYTEQDVREMARVLTGWVDFGYRNTTFEDFGSQFISNRHDRDDKILSHRFDNVTISNAEESEYLQLIDIIFSKEEVSKFISRKLYRWFLFYEINEEIEANIIEPMAAIIREDNYNIKRALRTLLSSEQFFGDNIIGCMIKNPIDFSINFLKNIGLQEPETDFDKYTYWYRTFGRIRNFQMVYYDLPSVAGWPAYYQEPSYYQIWLNTVTLPLRLRYATPIVSRGDRGSGINLIPDYVDMISDFTEPDDINSLLEEFVEYLLPKPLSVNQILVLKEIIIPGLIDEEWTKEYKDYIANPTAQSKEVLQRKLAEMILYIIKMPEYQLM